MAENSFRMRQIIMLFLIGFLLVLIVTELFIFLPGFLGAITFYILGRDKYFYLTEKRKWRKGWTAILFMFAFLALIGLPVYYAVTLVSPKINVVLGRSDELLKGIESVSKQIESYTGQEVFSKENLNTIQKNITSFIPRFLNSTANSLGNLLVMFFVLFFMLTSGRALEQSLNKFIPLSKHSVDELANETRNMVRANAIGIPLISLIQGVTAALGYWIFGLNNWGLWGFLTGIFAFFPVVGTLMIWVPLVIHLYTQDQNWQATGLMIYSLIVTGNVDYLARITLMKKIGNVHPLITIFGVIVGLRLFGFMGFIFGPLVLSYLFILIKLYSQEFVESTKPAKN